MIFAAEIRKITRNGVTAAAALTLFFACVFLSYYTVMTDRSKELTSERIQAEYAAETSVFITNANRNLKELQRLGSAADTYSYEYFEKVAGIYAQAQNEINIKNDSAVGWDGLLDSDAVFILCIIASAIVGAVSVYEEKRTGSLSVVFASKNGRGKTAFAKLGAAVLISVLFCIFLCFTSLAVIALSGHLSGGGAELQTAYEFRFSPYNITLFQAYMIIVAGRALACVFVCGACAVLSNVLNSYVLILAGGLLPAAAEFALYKINFSGVDVFAKNVNLFSFGGGYLLKRYYSVRLFGCADAYPVCIILSVIILVLFVPLFVFLFCKGSNVKKPKLKKERLIIKKSKTVVYKTLFGWELKKYVLKAHVIIIIIACFAARAALSAVTFTVSDSTNETLYRQYCTEFGDMDIEDADAALKAETERVITGLQLRGAAEELYKNNEITEAEYNEMMTEYGYCSAREYVVQRCGERMSELVAANNASGAPVRFIYDTGYKKLLSSDADFILILLLLICISSVFSYESESGFYAVMRTTKNGRKKTFLSKILCVFCTAAVLFAVFSVSDLIALYRHISFASLDASVLSLDAAKNFENVSIKTYLIILYAVRFLSYETFALFIASVSALLQKTVSAFSVSAVFVFAPYVIRAFGSLPRFADISALMSANAVLLSPDKTAADFIVLPVFAALLLIAAYVRFTFKGKGRV